MNQKKAFRIKAQNKYRSFKKANKTPITKCFARAFIHNDNDHKRLFGTPHHLFKDICNVIITFEIAWAGTQQTKKIHCAYEQFSVSEFLHMKRLMMRSTSFAKIIALPLKRAFKDSYKRLWRYLDQKNLRTPSDDDVHRITVIEARCRFSGCFGI